MMKVLPIGGVETKSGIRSDYLIRGCFIKMSRGEGGSWQQNGASGGFCAMMSSQGGPLAGHDWALTSSSSLYLLH